MPVIFPRLETDAPLLAGAAPDEALAARSLLTLVEQVAQVGHWRLSLADGRIYWSPEVFRIHGLEPAAEAPGLDEAVGFYHPDDRASVEKAIARAIEEKSPFEFNLRLVRRDGEVRHIVSRGACEFGAEGEVGALFGVILDMTNTRRAEQAVRDSEARYRLLSEAANDMIVLADLDTTRRYVSPAAFELLGYEPAELIGTKPLDAVHPEDFERYKSTLAKLIKGCGIDTVSSRQRYRRKDGEYVWVEASFRLIRGLMGEPTGYVAAVRDISDRMAAANAVRESEARYRLLAENTSELIMLGHDDGRRAYISPASERLLGFTPEELGAMRLRDYVHPEDLDRLFATTSRLSQMESEVSTVYRALHKTRGWVWVEGVFRRIPGARAPEPTIVATFRDVSERIRTDDALRHAKEGAEAARAQAEAASRAKSDFLASMSHEIRTPLNGILGFTDLLLEEASLDPAHARLVERIQSAGAALLTVVNDILDFSEIESGKIELDPRRFVLAGLVENTASIVRGLAAKKRLEIRIVIDRRAPHAVIGDADRLRQVLLNLLNNAVKFTPAGSVTVSVKQLSEGPGGVGLRFAVSDTGIGIPETKRARLFERFSQVDGSIRREFGGTGLGLAISKSLVEMMGGTVGVESEVGHGARFWFDVVMPAAEEAEIAVSTPAAAAPVRRAKILLAEDLEINQELALAVLKGGGHEVDVVADGAEAVKAVQANAYDLVLMDIHMPGMDGVTATQHIRALAGPVSAIPIVAMTANVLPEQVAKFRAAGMDDHVGKPFKRAELFAVIERWTSPKQAPVEIAPPPQPVDGVVDLERREQVESLLGSEATARLLGRLSNEIEDRLGDRKLASADADTLAHDAHAIVSAAGLLGYLRLSGVCSALEEACRQSWPYDDRLAAVRIERDLVLADIAATIGTPATSQRVAAA